jgi:hypothetical protein
LALELDCPVLGGRAEVDAPFDCLTSFGVNRFFWFLLPELDCPVLGCACRMVLG